MAYLKVKQKFYGNLEIVDTLKGSVSVNQNTDSVNHIIRIEREHLQEFINQLENCL